MVESMKELNQKVQKPNYKKVGNWMERHIVRDAALPFTWLILHTDFSANQVTLGCLIVGILGIFCITFESVGAFFFGSLLLMLWYILDQTDGQVARYRGTSSLSGRFFDYLMHHIIHGSVFFGLGVYAYRFSDQSVFMIWGYVAALAITLFNCLSDSKFKVFIERFGQPGNTYRCKSTVDPQSAVQSVRKEKSEFAVIFSILHKICEIHVVIATLLITSLIAIVFSGFPDLRGLLFMVYGVIAPVIVIIKGAYLIINRKIDREFEENYEKLS